MPLWRRSLLTAPRWSYYTVLSGSSADAAAAIVLGSDGSAYITGSTSSTDFPVTAGAMQTIFNPAGASQGFLVKVNPAGAVAYSTYINGTAYTQATGIAIDSAGEVFVTGSGGPGYPVSSGQPTQGFILKLDAGLSNVLLSIYGYGGGLIALDSQSNIYLAGNALPNLSEGPGNTGPVFTLPALPSGAFQSTRSGMFCSTASGPGGGFSSFCPYQYVAKLDPTGKLLWGTYVTGTYGALAAGMAVDSAGNVIVAGATNSSDYPVTPGAFQTDYTAAAPPVPTSSGPFNSFTGPPNATGYVTKVNATGTRLIWSTYFGGSFQDQITGMAVSPSGEIILSGRAGSSDLPVLAGVPNGCLPSANQVLGFVASLAPDGASAGAAQLVQGAPDCLYLSCSNLDTYQGGWPLALRPDGTVVVAGSNGSLAAIGFSSSSRLACITDPADNAQIATVAPGQLISIFGADLAPAVPYTPTNGVAQSSASPRSVFQWRAGADPLFRSPANQRAGSLRNRWSQRLADAGHQPTDCGPSVRDTNAGSGRAAARHFSLAGRIDKPVSGLVDMRRDACARPSCVGAQRGWVRQRLHQSGDCRFVGHGVPRWLRTVDSRIGDGRDRTRPGRGHRANTHSRIFHRNHRHRYDEPSRLYHGRSPGTVASWRRCW
jgi:hypothetical protein